MDMSLEMQDLTHAGRRAFTLDKALYELADELNSRPEWGGIPLNGLLKMIP